MEEKKCTECGRSFPPTTQYFHVDKGSPSGLYPSCKECKAQKTQARRKAVKQQVFDHYGNECSCCGESEPCFLTIDHIDSNGAEHRRSINAKSGDGFYRWVIKNGFPDDLRTMCYNCNCGRQINGGVCPHVTSRCDN